LWTDSSRELQYSTHSSVFWVGVVSTKKRNEKEVTQKRKSIGDRWPFWQKLQFIMQQEKISFEVENNGAAKPVIASTNLDGATLSTRPIELHDFDRVLDFGKIIPASPADQVLRHQSGKDENDGSKPFQEHLFCLRGCFLFYFNPQSVVRSDGSNAHYRKLPLGVIPLERTEIEFPPGGRRVFQQHARTAGTRGYEFVIKHTPKDGTLDAEKGIRREEYIVAESLTQREEWKAVLTSRSGGLKRDTTLRPGVAPPSEVNNSVTNAALSVASQRTLDQAGESKRNLGKGDSTSKLDLTEDSRVRSDGPKNDGSGEATNAGATFAINSLAQYAANDNDEAGGIMDNELLKQFTKHRFRDEEWIDQYFQTHTDLEAEAMSREIEQTQLSVKRGLRGAVLEQYKYFVEASCEMTTMGTEVTKLRKLVDYQADVVSEMKDVNFADAYTESDMMLEDDGMYYDEDDDDDSEDEDEEREASLEDDEDSAASSQSSSSAQKSQLAKARKEADSANTGVLEANAASGRMEIPEWLEDVTEEISAFLKECRFTEATDLTLKAKHEVSELLNQVSHRLSFS
jgi:hypothetical protein